MFKNILHFLTNIKRSFRKQPMALEPIEEEGITTYATQWALNDKAPQDLSQVKIVEVRIYPKKTNYMREGEDPNLKITHYPPSNRLH